MRSFLSILLAGSAAFLAVLILSPSAAAQDGMYALEITLEENGEVFSAPRVVVEPGKAYSVQLIAGADYDFSIQIPPNTRRAALQQFERDLGRSARDFLLVNTELSFQAKAEAQKLPEYGKLVSSNLLLRVAQPARAIRSDIPVSDRGLKTKRGEAIETLSITIQGAPFAAKF